MGMARLSEVLKGVEFSSKGGVAGIKVKGITDDSRDVAKGDAFIAINGYSCDGHIFIKDAVAKGAKVVIAEKDLPVPRRVKKVLVLNLRKSLPVIAANLYGGDIGKLKLIGVTGTNGKTTITYLIENILKAAGRGAGVIGTINYRFKDTVLCAKNTTPGVFELNSILADMARSRVKYAVMEISSHSLDQGRVDGLLFDAAVFTNVTAEHLDYHKTLESYFAAKAKLFEKLKGGATAILNADDRKVSALRKAIDKKVLTYGLEEKADITADDKKLSLNGSAFTAVTPAGPISIETKLIGLHNISNILAAIGVALTQKVRLHAIKKGVESLVSVPGRLERVETGQPYKVLVDYAHTEDALYNILSILRQVTTRGIITVFGCGGDRDRSKRPLMGKVACRFSDNVIVTSDNPRSEEPRQIISEIEKGIRGEFANYSVVEDRREAIEKALDLARAGDIVVIAGKGHEKYQIIKGSVMPFDDCEVVRAAISRRYEGR